MSHRDNFKPPTTPGIQCLSNDVHKGLNRAHAFVGLFIDAGLLALPVWIVYTRMIFSKKTLSVLLVFSFGIFAIVTGIVRIVLMLTVDFTSDM